jgi:penicillin amidase
VGDGGYDLGARGGQIRDRLQSRSMFEPADMLAIQMDDEARFLATWRELLLRVLDDAAIAENPARAEFRDLVRDWLPRAAPESVGYRLVRAFRLEIRERVFEFLSTPVKLRFEDSARRSISNQFEGSLWALLNEKPAHLLPAYYGSWEQLMLEAVDANLDYFATNYTGSLNERSWGELNTARIQHPLSKAMPVLSGWLDMPADQLTGDNNLPKAQGPSFGASERFAVSPGDEANGYFHIPAGPSGHPASAYYRSGHEDWVQGRPSRFLPGPAAHTLQLRPAGP